MNATRTVASPADTVARLGDLAALGWNAAVHAPPGQVPSLHARNPEPGAAALFEHVYAHHRENGTWAYWWPWAQPITDEPAQAAAVIVRVPRPAGTP